jgi:hypothetical protein
MPMDAVTYVRDKKHALRGMLLVYQDLIDKRVIEDPPFNLDQIALILADDVKKLGLLEAKFLMSVCDLLRSD